MNDDILINLKHSITKVKKYILLIILILILVYAFSGIYSIGSNETGVLTRFGKIINSKVTPGIHFAFPYPVDKIYKVPVQKIQRIYIDDFISEYYNENSTSYIFKHLTGLSSYCVSADNNIVEISCIVQYKIIDPVQYIFRTENNEELLKNIICNNMIHALSNISIQDALKIVSVLKYLRENITIQLNKLDVGISITSIEIQEIKPPDDVRPYFDDVVNAKIERHQMISKAKTYKNDGLNQLDAEINRIIQESKGYKKEVIQKAEGDAQRFLKQLNAYYKDKDITKKRLYLDFVKKIYPLLKDKVIVSENNNQGIVKLKIFSK